jgi:hypothetical protein
MESFGALQFDYSKEIYNPQITQISQRKARTVQIAVFNLPYKSTGASRILQ